jgi:predicted exporter
MATFLISGLLGALLCCRLFLGWRHSKTSQNNRFLSLENHPVTILPLKLPSLSPFWGLAVLALLVVFINRNLSFNDDLRSFGNPAEKMLETNRWIKKLIGKDGTWSMLIVHGNNVNQVLEHEQELLARIKEEYPDAKSQCLSEIIPSIALQERHRGNWMEAITNHREKFIQYFKKLGLPESRLDHMIDDLKVIKPQPWQTFRDLPGFRILELQMLEQSNVAYSCILLRGVQKDLLQKTLEGFDKTYLFDRVENINTLLRSYREETSKWLLLAGISTLLIQVLLLGFIRGTKVGLPPLLAIAITWAGLLIVHPEGINLFHILSSVLIWGVGLDYALMVNRNKVLEGSTILANSSSAFTSILAFGLLSLSESPVLASLGLTASIGISLVLVLSFLFRPKMHVSPS